MTDEQRRAAENRLEAMTVELKEFANKLGCRISLSAYPDGERETRNAEIFIQYNPHKTVNETWFVAHEQPHFREILTELENKILKSRRRK